jgi:hypothetical protein
VGGACSLVRSQGLDGTHRLFRAALTLVGVSCGEVPAGSCGFGGVAQRGRGFARVVAPLDPRPEETSAEHDPACAWQWQPSRTAVPRGSI